MSFKDVFKKVYNNMFGSAEAPTQDPWPYPKSENRVEPQLEKKSVQVTPVPKAVAPVNKPRNRRKHVKPPVKK